MALRIVSWNWLNKNSKMFRAVDETLRSVPHVACVQEAADIARPQIENTNYVAYWADDFRCGDELAYLCILVKEGVECKDHRVVLHNPTPSTCLSNKIRQLLGRGIETMFLQSHSVLIRYEGRVIRIVNCHLDARCSANERQLMLREVAKAHFDGNPVILCGDLNSFGCWWKNLFFFGWAFGVQQLFVNEHVLLNEFFEQENLARVLPEWKARRIFRRNVVTHPISCSQLDHIAYSKGTFEVEHQLLFPARHNSDHRGILADFEFAQPTQRY